MKIVLATLNAKYIHASLALRYLRAYAEPDFPDLDLCEYTIKDQPMNVVADIYKRKPDVIGFSCYIWNIEETIPIIEMLRKVLPDVKIVLGGPEVSYDTEAWMKRIEAADAIVIGEGEKTFHHLLQEFSSNGNLETVQGIVYRDGEGRPKRTFFRDKLELDEIPSPFSEEDIPTLVNRVVYFEASRGCPFSCSYCLSSIETGVRYFDIERTKRDLQRLVEGGVKTVKFVDRTFNIHMRYALQIFEYLIELHRTHPDVVFQFEITADILKPRVVEFLAEHAPPGLFRFEIGVQSTNDVTNEIVNRKQNWEKLTRTVLGVKATGKIDQHLDLIAGLPQEDYASFKKTFNDVFALEVEELQLGFLKMLRGVGVRLDADKYGYKFMEKAPYEILSNEVLPFDDVIRIKRVEDVLEKYWNAHRTNRTVRYLVAEEFPSAFDFFQDFGDYWEEQGWNRIGHQVEDLFRRLLAFLQVRGLKREDVVLGLMKVDYLIGFKNKPRGIWWERTLEKADAQQYIQALISAPELLGESWVKLGLTEQEMHKHCLLETVPFQLLDEKGMAFEPGEAHLLVTYYEPGQKQEPQFFTCALRQAALAPVTK